MTSIKDLLVTIKIHIDKDVKNFFLKILNEI